MSRRKPVLQLGQKPINRHTPDRDYSNNSIKSGAGLGLLGSYGDDSDDGQVNASDDISDDEVKLPKSTLDSKVADFLKEIDDLEASVPSPSTKSSKKKERRQEKSDASMKDESNSFKISWGNWQQCIDENTQHPYYWNTVTNEVTWTLPQEIADQYNSSTNNNESSVPSTTKQSSADSKRSFSRNTTSKENPILATSLKAAILENKKIKEKQKAKLEKRTEASRVASYNKPEMKNLTNKNDIDIDAELDSVLLAKDSKRKSRFNLHPDLDSVPKKRKKSPLPESKEKNTNNSLDNSLQKTTKREEKSKLAEEQMELQVKTDLWMQWENELAQNDEEFTDKGVSQLSVKSDDDRRKDVDRSVPEDDHEDDEDHDLSKYDMTAVDESSNASDKKDDENSNVPRNVEDASIKTKPEAFQDATEDTKVNSDIKLDLENESSVIFRKLECFETSQTSISFLHKLFTETEVRLNDWKAGALSSEYFKLKLGEATERLSEYEKTVMPKGWLCHWDSRYKRYYYTNKRGRTQWDFPHPDTSDNQNSTKTTSQPLSPPETTNDADDKANQPTDVSMSTSNKTTDSEVTAEDKSNTDASDSLSALPEDSKVPDSKKPATAAESADKTSTYSAATPYPGMSGGVVDYNAYNMQNYYWNMSGYNMQYPGSYASSSTVPGYDESFRNSPMHDQPPPPPGEDVAPLPPSNSPPPPPLPPGEAEEPIPPPPPPLEPNPSSPDDGGIEMEISDVEDNSSPIISEFQPSAELSRAPVEYTSQPTTVPILASAAVINSAEIQKQPLAVKPVTSQKKIKKVKKEKTVVKKPPKQMFGMVAKWQKAKQEIEEEEKRLIRESEAELDREMDVQQRIEKWKAEQFESGKASLNANFQPVSDDWKKRVKMRKNKIT